MYRPAGGQERTVALKRINSDGWREVMLLDKLEHRNILKVEGVLRDMKIPGTDTLGK